MTTETTETIVTLVQYSLLLPAQQDETPSPSVCSSCGETLEIGDWPFCPHDSVYSQNAQSFPPIVLFQDVKTGKYSFPGRDDQPVPNGFRKVNVCDSRQGDRITREINTYENAAIRERWHQENAARHEKNKLNRENLKSIMHKLSPAGQQFAERMMEYTDRKRDARSRKGPGDANFHMDVLSFDSSNREGHRDSRTDWKSRKA